MKTANVNEAKRLLDAMSKRLAKVLESKMLLEIQRSPSGRIIGIKLQTENATQKLLLREPYQADDNTGEQSSNIHADVQSEGGIEEDDYKSGRLT